MSPVNNYNAVILIVDDNPVNLEVLLKLLSKANFKVLVASDGESAINQSQYAKPDMVLLDVMMPRMDGFEVCRLLKENEETRDIPVIFMTALSDTEEKVRGFTLGAVDYITKPFQHEEVLVRLTTHLTIRNLQKELVNTNNILNENLTQIKEDLKIAQNIQNRLLPRKNMDLPGLEYYFEYIPLDRVGGDFLDIVQISPTKTRVLIADVVGHGIQASLITMAIKGEYEDIKLKSSEPATIIMELNERFRAHFGALRTHFPCIVVDIDDEENSMTYASAGHPDQLLLCADKREWLSYTGPLLGISDQIKVKNIKFDFTPGCRLFLYTDGLPESFDEEGQMYGEDRILTSVQESQDRNVRKQIAHMLKHTLEFRKEAPPTDDVTILALEKT